MTALAADAQRDALQGVTRHALPVEADEIMYVGAIASINSEGNAIAATTTAGTKCAGVVHTGFDNTGGADGVLGSSPARYCVVERGVAYSFAAAGTPKAGLPAYVVDDNSVTSVVGNVLAGVFVEPDPANSSNWFVYFPGSVGMPQGAAIAPLAITYSSNDPATAADSAVTVADGDAISAAETVEYLDELTAKLNALIVALESAGVISA